MNVLLIGALIVCSCLLEIILSSLSPLVGLFFSLISFSSVLLDPAFFFLSFAILALHIFYISLQNIRNLSYTRELAERQDYLNLPKRFNQ